MDKTDALARAKDYFLSHSAASLVEISRMSKRMFNVHLGTDDLTIASVSEPVNWEIQRSRVIAGKCPHCENRLPIDMLSSRDSFDAGEAVASMAKWIYEDMKKSRREDGRLDPAQVKALIELMVKGKMDIIPSTSAKASMDRVISLIEKHG